MWYNRETREKRNAKGVCSGRLLSRLENACSHVGGNRAERRQSADLGLIDWVVGYGSVHASEGFVRSDGRSETGRVHDMEGERIYESMFFSQPRHVKSVTAAQAAPHYRFSKTSGGEIEGPETLGPRCPPWPEGIRSWRRWAADVADGGPRVTRCPVDEQGRFGFNKRRLGSGSALWERADWSVVAQYGGWGEIGWLGTSTGLRLGFDWASTSVSQAYLLAH